MNDPGKGHYRAVVSARESLSASCVLLTIERPRGFPDAAPGHFISIRASDSIAPLLRRPYSILSLTDGELSLLVKVVGMGSSLIAGSIPGDTLDIIGPLGGAVFPEPSAGDAVMVAGGTGLAPILFAAQLWQDAELHLVYGASCADELFRSIVGDGFAGVHYATIDGSHGYHGDVVSLVTRLVESGTLDTFALYSCGPKGMVSALEAAVGGRFSEHFTSLETIMACGVGACRGCAVPVLAGGGPVYRSVCADGTVFRASEIDWEGWDEP